VRRAVAVFVVCSVALSVGCTGRPSDPTGPPEAPASEGRGGANELAEQEEQTAERLDALRSALAAGTFRTGERAAPVPTPGWEGERVMAPNADDWEPAVAADPNAPYVYLVATRYGVPKPCKGNCPTPWMALEVSKDGGRTWSDGVPLCACKGSGQYDPIIEVVPDTGDVYAVYMNGYNVVFIRSTDHGATWSEPVPTYGRVAWNDKPVMTSSADGRDVYVSWNGPNGGDPWIAQSHDGGRTWDQTRVVRSKRYFFAYDATVTPDGTVVFSEGSLTYTAPGANPEGVVQQHALVSHDAGATWLNVVVDTVPVGEPCADCRADYYLGHSGVSVDATGRLVFAYDAARRPAGMQRIYVRTSTDEGDTWSRRTALSPRREQASSPNVEATGDGDVRLVFMRTSHAGDLDRWNAWFRSSTDGGRTWSSPVRISDSPTGADYKHPDGFEEIYGDYGEIAITSTGATFAAWGEGFSHAGPGGVWFNRQT
jgi:photosystem II stability/assembly factor-like uncharacterized protein